MPLRLAAAGLSGGRRLDYRSHSTENCNGWSKAGSVRQSQTFREEIDMRKLIPLAASLAFVGLAASASAQERAYDNGPIWDVTAVQTKPGHFNDYIRFISTTWRAEQEQLKKAGYVVDYKVLTTLDARDNEPDVLLSVEYKDLAAMDIPLDKQDAMARELFGSLAGADKADIDRESFRTLRGDVVYRELILK
jgi:hypothetical protein